MLTYGEDPWVLGQFCQCLQFVEYLDQKDWKSNIKGQFKFARQILTFNVDGETPRQVGWIEDLDNNGEQRLIIMSAGVENAQQALGMFACWSDALDAAGQWSAGIIRFQAQETLRRWIALILSGLPVTFVGHSYGGALVQALVAYLMDMKINGSQLPFDKYEIITFGSPKPGGAQLAQKLRDITIRRYMYESDIVPSFPNPSLLGARAILAAGLLAPAVRLLWGRWEQTHGGRVLYPDGRLVTQDQSLVGSNLSYSDTLDWCYDRTSPSGVAHQIETYQKALGATALQATKRASRAYVPPVPDTPETVELNNNNVALQAALDAQPDFLTVQAVKELNLLAQANSDVIKAIDPSDFMRELTTYLNSGERMQLPTRLLARVAKRGTRQPDGSFNYYVEWMGRQVANSEGHKSRAVTAAKHINSMLRYLANLSSIDSVAMPNSMADFISAVGALLVA